MRWVRRALFHEELPHTSWSMLIWYPPLASFDLQLQQVGLWEFESHRLGHQHILYLFFNLLSISFSKNIRLSDCPTRRSKSMIFWKRPRVLFIFSEKSSIYFWFSFFFRFKKSTVNRWFFVKNLQFFHSKNIRLIFFSVSKFLINSMFFGWQEISFFWKRKWW